MKAHEIHPGKLARPRHEGTDMLPCDPTPEQIAEMCLEIQATWTMLDRFNRIVDRRYLGGVEIAEYHLGQSVESKGFE